jgi:hypothetical protein
MLRSRSRITRQLSKRECFLIHREVELRGNMGGVEGDVPEPSPDSVDVAHRVDETYVRSISTRCLIGVLFCDQGNISVSDT